MTFDDIKKLATGSVLFSLDRAIVPRLLTLVYLLGLAAIFLWGLDHLFEGFRFGFGNGLWAILEVIVFGLIAFVALRAVCEMILIYYKTNERSVQSAMAPHGSTSLIDDVAGAIEELANEEDAQEAADAKTSTGRSSGAAASTASATSKSSRSASPSTSRTAAKGTAAKRGTTKSAASKSASTKTGPTSKTSGNGGDASPSGGSTTTRRTAKRTPKPKSS